MVAQWGSDVEWRSGVATWSGDVGQDVLRLRSPSAIGQRAPSPYSTSLYPTPSSVVKYWGFAGSCSNFDRSCDMYTRK